MYLKNKFNLGFDFVTKYYNKFQIKDISFILIIVTSFCKIIFGYSTFIKYAIFSPSIYIAIFFLIYMYSFLSSSFQFNRIHVNQSMGKFAFRNIVFYSVIYFLLFFICIINVKIGSSLFFQGVDGRYNLVNNFNSNIFAQPFFYNTSDVLQGLGIEKPFNYNYKLDPGYYLLAIGKSYGISLSHSFWATSLFLSLIYFLQEFRLSKRTIIFSSILTPIYLFIPTSISMSLIPQLVPHLILSMSIHIGILTMLLKEKRSWRHIFRYLSLTLFLIIYLILLNPTYILIFVFSLFLFSILILVIRRKATIKFDLIYFSFLAILLLLMKVPHYLYGQLYDTAAYTYADEYSWGGSVLNKFASSIFLERKGAVFVYLLAFGIAVYLAIKRINNNVFIFSTFYVTYVLLLNMYGLIWLQNPDKYTGIRPVYFEFSIWAFVLPLLIIFFSALSNYENSSLRKKTNAYNQFFGIEILICLLFLTNMISFNFNEYPNSITESKQFRNSANPEINKLLGIQMHNGSKFNGRFFLDIPEYPEKDFADIIKQMEDVIGLTPWRNELWGNQIPTLNQYGQLISKKSYFLLTNSFSSESDLQVRNSINMVNYNKIASLFGVKYLITTDTNIFMDNNVNILKKFTINNDDYFFAELINTNLGQFSPLNQNIVDDFNSKYEFRDNLENMLYDEFYVDKDVSEGLTLVKADYAYITYKNNKYFVKAASNSTSVIILPIEFSNCFKLNRKNAEANIVMFEVNWGLIGIKFTGNLDISIEYKNGLFDSPTCKLTKNSG
jgi:hypothetical protein